MDNPDPPLTPLKAFQDILRAQYRKRLALADEITDKDWFLFRQVHNVIIDVEETPNTDPPLREDMTAQEREEFAAAWTACKTLRASVQQGKIRLRGRGPGDLFPRDIDPQDAMAGELVIWDDTLDMGRERKPYLDVRCTLPGLPINTEPARRGAPHQSSWLRPNIARDGIAARR
jgi:hypothetical protein